MSDALRVVTFAAPDAAVWGAIVDAPEGSATVLAGGAELIGTDLELDCRDEQWEIRTPEASLTVAALGPSQATDGEAREELCQVSGTVAAGGQSLTLQAPGRRAVRPAPDQSTGSWRDVAVWLDGHGVAVFAQRRSKASGHSDESLASAVFEPDDEAIHIAEARLSTTYADGLPLRVGVELWLGEEESEQYPLRMAGEAAAPGVTAAMPAFDVHVVPLRAHWRGHEGAGIYILSRRR